MSLMLAFFFIYQYELHIDLCSDACSSICPVGTIQPGHLEAT